MQEWDPLCGADIATALHPIDSAGHDEVEYIGSAGGTPKRHDAAVEEFKVSLNRQEALLAAAKKASAEATSARKAEAEKARTLRELLGAEEAAAFAAFKRSQRSGQAGH